VLGPWCGRCAFSRCRLKAVEPFSVSYRPPPAAFHHPVPLAQDQSSALGPNPFASRNQLIMLPALGSELFLLGREYLHHSHHVPIALHVAVEPASELASIGVSSILRTGVN
jgi:hypothetical protein